jgi:hypothetical protein
VIAISTLRRPIETLAPFHRVTALGALDLRRGLVPLVACLQSAATDVSTVVANLDPPWRADGQRLLRWKGDRRQGDRRLGVGEGALLHNWQVADLARFGLVAMGVFISARRNRFVAPPVELWLWNEIKYLAVLLLVELCGARGMHIHRNARGLVIQSGLAVTNAANLMTPGRIHVPCANHFAIRIPTVQPVGVANLTM